MYLFWHRDQCPVLATLCNARMMCTDALIIVLCWCNAPASFMQYLRYSTLKGFERLGRHCGEGYGGSILSHLADGLRERRKLPSGSGSESQSKTIWIILTLKTVLKWPAFNWFWEKCRSVKSLQNCDIATHALRIYNQQHLCFVMPAIYRIVNISKLDSNLPAEYSLLEENK